MLTPRRKILICEGPNATGKCTYQVYPLETCNTLDPVFNGKAATFALDGEGFYCYPHTQKCGGICTSPTGCTFGAVTFEYANKYNLTTIGWDTLIQSFDCHLNQTSSEYGK